MTFLLTWGLNKEPMIRAVRGPHVYLVRHAKRTEENALFGCFSAVR